MSGRPAQIRQRDLKQTICAAQKAGAKEVRVNLTNGAVIVIPLVADNEKPTAAKDEWAIDDAAEI
jgi:hypothetical protein